MPSIVALLVVSALGLALAQPLSGDQPSREQPSGTLVFLSRGNRLTAVDVASGDRTVRRVGGVASCAPELQVTGGHVVFAGIRRDQTVVFSVPLALDRPPRALGTAHAFVRSATGGRVWLAGTDCDRSKMVGVKEVTVGGRVTMSTHRRVPGAWLAGAVKEGLVMQRGRALVVWDPSTGRRNDLALDALLDVQGQLMAGCPKRSRCRRLAILDAGTGRTTVARPKAPFRLDLSARFSPDGSLLAAPAVAKRRWHVELVATHDGTTTIVPGSATEDAYPDLRWAPSSGWLFFRAANDRLRAYRPGQPRAVTLPFRWPRKAVAFVAG
jgi:hypothetical protein